MTQAAATTSAERQLEEQLIEKLRELKYEIRADIRDRAALEKNFRAKFQALNHVRLSNWFLYFTLQTLKPTFESVATGSTIKTIGMPFFRALCVTVPPIAEQQRIAACLGTLDTRLAAASAKLAALRTHNRGLMQQLFPAVEGD